VAESGAESDLGIQQPDPRGKYAIPGNECFDFGAATMADLASSVADYPHGAGF